MSIMQQSSRAQDRTLGAWFNQIDQGLVKLPRFQRFEAWDRGRITSFLNTIISNLPVGVALVLEVAGPEKFGDAATEKIAAMVRQVKGFQGGRFYINEWREMFAPRGEDDRTAYYYVGHLDQRGTKKCGGVDVSLFQGGSTPLCRRALVLTNFPARGELCLSPPNISGSLRIMPFAWNPIQPKCSRCFGVPSWRWRDGLPSGIPNREQKTRFRPCWNPFRHSESDWRGIWTRQGQLGKRA